MAREQIRFTPDEIQALGDQLYFELHVQRGQTVTRRGLNGLTADLVRFLENQMTTKIYGETEAQARKMK